MDALKIGKTPIISESLFYGSGNIGVVGSLMSYYECTKAGAMSAIEGLQRMSILGVPMIGL